MYVVMLGEGLRLWTWIFSLDDNNYLTDLRIIIDIYSNGNIRCICYSVVPVKEEQWEGEHNQHKQNPQSETGFLLDGLCVCRHKESYGTDDVVSGTDHLSVVKQLYVLCWCIEFWEIHKWRNRLGMMRQRGSAWALPLMHVSKCVYKMSS